MVGNWNFVLLIKLRPFWNDKVKSHFKTHKNGTFYGRYTANLTMAILDCLKP